MLRGPYLYPTATERWLQDTGYAPPPDWDYRRPWRGECRGTWVVRNGALRQLQNAYPGKRVEEFTTADLIEFLTRGRTPQGKLWAGNTVASRMGSIVGFFTWAADPEEGGLIQQNPAANLAKKLKKSRSDRRAGKIHNWLTAEEVRALLASCDPSDPVQVRARVVLELLVNTGLRCSEAAALKWSDVNLFAGQLSRTSRSSDDKRTSRRREDRFHANDGYGCG